MVWELRLVVWTATTLDPPVGISNFCQNLENHQIASKVNAVNITKRKSPKMKNNPKVKIFDKTKLKIYNYDKLNVCQNMYVRIQLKIFSHTNFR